jgi:hypothetical protein
LVQDQGGTELQPAGILKYVEDLKRGPNTEVGPKDFFEIASNSQRAKGRNVEELSVFYPFDLLHLPPVCGFAAKVQPNSLSNKEEQTWVTKEKETKAKGSNRKRPSSVQRKKEN